MEKVQSEYGKGLVVCLFKFGEHLNDDMSRRLRHVHHWYTNLKKKGKSLEQYDISVQRDVQLFEKCELEVHKGNYAEAFSQMMELWASGASDHLYEMEAPNKLSWFMMGCPNLEKKIKEMSDLAITMGHGHDPTRVWKYEDYHKLYTLAKEIAIGIDKALGMDCDWGQW